jgi:hypothetical protein
VTLFSRQGHRKHRLSDVFVSFSWIVLTNYIDLVDRKVRLQGDIGK